MSSSLQVRRLRRLGEVAHDRRRDRAAGAEDRDAQRTDVAIE